VNYFELYPGDYLRDTTRLTLVEHGAYLRLLMAYYSEEKPLPKSDAELYVIVSAISAADKAAVRKVADRFFPVGEDGVRRNGRADAEIEKAQKRITIARENGSKGGRKPNPAGNPTGNPSGNPAGSSRGNPERTQRGTHSGEALHTPHAIHHQEQKPAPHAPSSPGTPAQPPPATEAGRACLLLRQAGCARVNPSNPDLLAALAEGVTPEAIRDTYGEKPDATNPFAWAITTARSRHAEGPKQISTGPPNGRQPSDSKTFTGLKKLQGLKTHETLPTRVAAERDPGRLIEAHDPEP
jgi:uncharacterized protein YdaU (DUF1376 family)